MEEKIIVKKKYLELKKNMSERLTGENNPSKKNSVKIKKNQTIIDEKYIKKITLFYDILPSSKERWVFGVVI